MAVYNPGDVVLVKFPFTSGMAPKADQAHGAAPSPHRPAAAAATSVDRDVDLDRLRRRLRNVQDPAGTLRPLLSAALDNALTHGDAALTGPIVRGDVNTVRAHLDDVLATFPQRRHPDFDHSQPEEQVASKLSVGDRLFEVAIGRRDHPHVDLDRLIPADAFERMSFEYAEKFRLDRRAHFTDFVQHEGAAIGRLELAFARAARARVGAGIGAEQFGLDQLGRQAVAVLIALGWAFGGSLLIALGLDRAMGGIRVAPQHEFEGLDLHLHEEQAYLFEE